LKKDSIIIQKHLLCILFLYSYKNPMAVDTFICAKRKRKCRIFQGLLDTDSEPAPIPEDLYPIVVHESSEEL
jgi:hypothetical protein